MLKARFLHLTIVVAPIVKVLVEGFNNQLLTEYMESLVTILFINIYRGGTSVVHSDQWSGLWSGLGLLLWISTSRSSR